MRRDVLALVASGLAAVVLVAASTFVLSADAEGRDGAPAGAAGAEHTAPAVAANGRTLFDAKGCSGCHALGSIRPTAPVGPDLSGLPAVAAARRPGLSAEAYVRESLTDPQAFVVPGFGGGPAERMPRLPLSEAEVGALVAFLLAPH